MKFFILICATAGLLASCSNTKPLSTSTATTDSVVVNTVERVRDTTIYLPGDTVSFLLTVPCPELRIDTTATSKTGKLKAKVKLQNGSLEVECQADSLQLVISNLREIVTTLKQKKETTTTIKVPVNVPKPYIPKWVWCLVAANVLYLGWRFRSPILKLVKSFS